MTRHPESGVPLPGRSRFPGVAELGYLWATMSDSERITELEIKVTHQERLLETLNQVIIDQAKAVAALKRTVEQLEANNQLPVGPGDEKPPHY